MRFITFEALGTGVRAFECAFSMRTSSFVHGLMTRRAVFAFTGLVDFVPLSVHAAVHNTLNVQRHPTSRISPHAPRSPRRSVPDVASRHHGLSPNWAFKYSRGQIQFM